jgi:hypothetical protein
VILVFGCLAQFMKCDEPHNTVTKIEVTVLVQCHVISQTRNKWGGKEPTVPKITAIPKTSSFECIFIFVNIEVHAGDAHTIFFIYFARDSRPVDRNPKKALKPKNSNSGLMCYILMSFY